MIQAAGISSDNRVRFLAIAGLALLGAALIFRFATFVLAMAHAIRFPFALDYGEGIVWQQLLHLTQGQGYGDITRYPFIVFHYPPVYHMLVAAIAAGTGVDQLVSGRLLSVLGTTTISAIAGLLVWRAVRAELTRGGRLICSIVAALVLYSYGPVMHWAPFMRVDMTALALSFLGIYFGIRAAERPGLIAVAALCFVLAVYTKQTSLAAPFATFLVLLITRPRLAMIGISICFIISAVSLILLLWVTEARFLDHILFYNVNRLDMTRLSWVGTIIATHGIYVLLVMMAVSDIARRYRWIGSWRDGIKNLGQRLQASEPDRICLVIGIHSVITTIMLLMVLKSGSDTNYFIEWMCVWSVLIGLSLRSVAALATYGALARSDTYSAPRFAALIPSFLAVQVMILPMPSYTNLPRGADQQQDILAIVDQVRRADRPVISDEMVILLRAGKEVVWEPAIFAELAGTGRWDERQFVAMVQAGMFAFFITEGRSGDRNFDSRYTPAVTRAMDLAYPRLEIRAGYVLHLLPN